ncbi:MULTISPECIES: hypothetical protein [Solibacillus]|uniref:hypothetical protein n=1 Tax=Solibacillus TaxID=648800 RepID=UPI0009A869DA|nr:hypothetical protein [Solibacillus isronensis]
MRDDVSVVEKRVLKICNTCEFNFGERCVAHGSLFGYGGQITNDDATCDEWGISLHAYLDEVSED